MRRMRLLVLVLAATCCCHPVVAPNGNQCRRPCPLGEFRCGELPTCIPQRLHCNGETDCENGADEKNCGDNRGWADDFDKALTLSNKSFDWNRRVLSKTCDLPVVPEMCSCTETRLKCGGRGLTDLPSDVPANVSRLYLEDNSLTIIKNVSFVTFTDLVMLNLKRNHIRLIEVNAFVGLRNLKKLYLNHNDLETVEPDTFKDLSSLEWLFLNENRLQILQAGTFNGLHRLTWLELRINRIHGAVGESICDDMPSLNYIDVEENSLSSLEMFKGCSTLRTLVVRHNSIEVIGDQALAELTNLIELDLSVNKVVKFPNEVFKRLSALDKLNISFNPLNVLQRDLFDGLLNLTSLDLRGILSTNMSIRLFQHLCSLDYIYFSQFRYCGFAPHVRSCEPNTDGISTFQDLLANFILRMSIWIVAIVTCVGNTSVMIGRTMMKHENKVHSLFIRNLCASDLIMGIYLLIIGSKDYMYRNAYNQYAQEWKESVGCHITGFLGMLSAEVTVLLLTYMSVERFLCVVFPYRDSRPNVGQAAAILVIIWLSGVALSVAPVMSPAYFGNFYGSNGVCFPLHLHEPYGAGWEYSVFVFMGINFISMIVILCAYTGMFISIQRTRRSIGSPLSLLSDMSFSKRFFFIVLTDSLVWMPITLLKFVALLGVPISGSLYAWIVIFILPINSAINPILYSLTTRTFTALLGNLVEKSSCCAKEAKLGKLRQQKDDALSAATCTTGVGSVLRPVKCFKVKRSSETEFSMSTVSSPTYSESTTKAFVSSVELPDVLHRSTTLNSVPELPSQEISTASTDLKNDNTGESEEVAQLQPQV